MQGLGDRDPVRLRQVAKIPGGYQRAAGEAKTHWKLLQGAGDGAGHAGVGRPDIGVGHAVDAGELVKVRHGVYAPPEEMLNNINVKLSDLDEFLPQVKSFLETLFVEKKIKKTKVLAIKEEVTEDIIAEEAEIEASDAE